MKATMTSSGFESKMVKEPVKICANLYSSGEFTGATHCTEERQTRIFKEAFKTDFIEPGAGNSIEEVHGTFTSGR